eukprot:Pgem_evm1s13142
MAKRFFPSRSYEDSVFYNTTAATSVFRKHVFSASMLVSILAAFQIIFAMLVLYALIIRKPEQKRMYFTIILLCLNPPIACVLNLLKFHSLKNYVACS